MSRELVKRCGTKAITAALLTTVEQLDLPEQAMRDLNIRLAVLFTYLRDHNYASIPYAFAMASTTGTGYLLPEEKANAAKA